MKNYYMKCNKCIRRLRCECCGELIEDPETNIYPTNIYPRVKPSYGPDVTWELYTPNTPGNLGLGGWVSAPSTPGSGASGDTSKHHLCGKSCPCQH